MESFCYCSAVCNSIVKLKMSIFYSLQDDRIRIERMKNEHFEYGSAFKMITDFYGNQILNGTGT